jgi:ribonuclease HI
MDVDFRWRTIMVMDKQLEKFQENTVYLWTDGACSGNPGPGGYAAYMFGWYTADREKWLIWREDMGSSGTTTNNRMELQAVVLGMSLIAKPDGAKVKLYSDSMYVVEGINEWLSVWVGRNGTKSDGEPVKNWDLWLHVNNFLKRHHVEAIHTKAHAEDKWNERVDSMAVWMASHPQSGPTGHNRREGRECIT